MLGYDWPRFHAAVNDLPAALLLVTVLFDVAAWLTKRDSLKAAALWTLWAGVIGGGGARPAGAQAQEPPRDREAGSELVGKHQKTALNPMGSLTGRVLV